MINITVLTIIDRIACFYSLSPFFNNDNRDFSFTWTSDPEWCLRKDKNRILVMMRQFIKPDQVNLELMEKLRQKYDRIAFFHDDAGGGIPRLEVLPFVDLFYTKALFKDRSLYGKELYGKELYSDYYHSKYGVIDPEEKKRATETRPEQLGKLRLSWNIGVGEYPRTKWKQRIAVEAAKRIGPFFMPLVTRKCSVSTVKALNNPGTFPVHARVGLISRPSISYQRKLLLDMIKGNKNFLFEPVSQSLFNFETARSKIVVSPFGWGELCLRDFEAVRSGALLMKPDMGHLETWPDIFIPGKTYVPISWEWDDLLAKTDYYLEHERERKEITANAVYHYKQELDRLQERFNAIMGEICGQDTR